MEKKVVELTKQLKNDFNTEDIIGILAVVDSNLLAGREDIIICSTLEQAKEEANNLWYHLTRKERANREISVCLLSAKVNENGNIVPFYSKRQKNI